MIILGARRALAFSLLWPLASLAWLASLGACGLDVVPSLTPAASAPASEVLGAPPAAAVPGVIPAIGAAPIAPAPDLRAAPPRGPLASAPLFSHTSHALVVGLLDFADPSLTDFSPTDRRDVVVAQTLASRGIPSANIMTLLDAQATRAAVLTALAASADATPLGGTLIVYYAGHGARTSDGDVGYIAYDTASDSIESTGLTTSALYEILAPRLAGKRVLFLADCCHSGALGGLAARLTGAGAIAASLTSADASNTSTGNWTYSQVLLEGLRGEACLDADLDGTVSVVEVEAGVRTAMRYRENQRSGANLGSLDPRLAMSTRSGAVRTGSLAGQFMRVRSGEIVRVQRDEGGQATVRGYDYAGYRDYEVSASALTPLSSTHYAVGTEMMVEWGGRTWPARVTATDGDFALITYPGWPAYWDEWILPDRVRSVTRAP